jgi:hypothetical protein
MTRRDMNGWRALAHELRRLRQRVGLDGPRRREGVHRAQDGQQRLGEQPQMGHPPSRPNLFTHVPLFHRRRQIVTLAGSVERGEWVERLAGFGDAPSR